MQLSAKAIQDLRIELRRNYGASVDIALDNEEVNRVGVLMLNLVASKLCA